MCSRMAYLFLMTEPIRFMGIVSFPYRNGKRTGGDEKKWNGYGNAIITQVRFRIQRKRTVTAKPVGRTRPAGGFSAAIRRRQKRQRGVSASSGNEPSPFGPEGYPANGGLMPGPAGSMPGRRVWEGMIPLRRKGMNRLREGEGGFHNEQRIVMSIIS